MAVSREFLVKLVGDAKQLTSTFDKVQKDARSTFGSGGLGGKLTSLLPSFKTIAIAGTAAFGAVSAAAGLSVKAAAEDAESQARLAQALKTTFGESEQLVKATEEFISSMSKAAAVSDDNLRPAMTTLVRATGDMAQSQKLLKLALDISAGSGRDLESVTIALARASQGQMTALTRLGVPLDQNAVKTKDFQRVTQQLADTFEGAAAASADSAQGKFRAFGIAVDELREQFGYILLPTVTEVVDFMTKRLIPAVQLAIDQFRSQGVKAGLAYFVASFGDAGKAVIEQLRGVALAIVTLGDQIRPVAALIGLSLAPVIGFTKAWDLYNNIIKGSTNATVTVNKAFDDFSAKVEYARKKLDIIAMGPLDLVERRLAATTRNAKGAAGGLDEFGDGADGAGNKSQKAADKVKTFQDRLKDYTSAVKSAKSASDAFGRSQERVSESRLSLAEADKSLTKAQEELAKAQQGGTAEEIAAAQRKLAAAERGVTRSKFDTEEAVIAVRDAEREVNNLRQDPEASPDEIRKAEIRLAEAKFAVADSEDRQIETTDGLAEARRQLRIATDGLREGDAELLPFQSAVEEMTKRQEDAANRYTESINEQTEALVAYREALEAMEAVLALVPKFSQNNPVTGLIPLPPTPTTPIGGMPNPSTSTVININSTIADADLPEKLVDALRVYNRNFGPVQVQIL